MEASSVEEDKHRAMRMRKMRALEQQADSAKARLAMRKMVSERLSHPLLEQMRSSEFSSNPLADDERELDANTQRLAGHLSEVQKWLISEGGVVDEPEPVVLSREEADAALAAAAATTGDESSEEGIADLVALKAVVVDNDLTADGSGLDADEFVAALGKLWTSHSQQELMRLFMQIDADSDGRVTWQELLTFLLQKDQVGDDNEINRFMRDLDRSPPPPAGCSHAAPVTQILSIPDKDKYLTVGRDATMRLWQTDTLAHARTLQLPEKCWLNDAAYCETHRRVALASAHSKLLIFDTNTMRLQKAWRLTTVATAICIIEQPELSNAWAGSLVLGDKDGKVFVYDWDRILKHELIARYEVQLHDGWIEKLALSKEAGGLLSCSVDGKLKLSSLTGESMQPRPLTVSAHGKARQGMARHGEAVPEPAPWPGFL